MGGTLSPTASRPEGTQQSLYHRDRGLLHPGKLGGCRTRKDSLSVQDKGQGREVHQESQRGDRVETHPTLEQMDYYRCGFPQFPRKCDNPFDRSEKEKRSRKEREVTQKIPDEFVTYRHLPEKCIQIGSREQYFIPNFGHFRGFCTPVR